MEPIFVFKSLTCLRAELKHMRIATTQKIKAEYDRRLQNNLDAIETLRANFHIWKDVDGPHVVHLRDPSDEALDQVRESKDSLIQFLLQEQSSFEGGVVVSNEFVNRVDLLFNLSMHGDEFVHVSMCVYNECY